MKTLSPGLIAGLSLGLAAIPASARIIYVGDLPYLVGTSELLQTSVGPANVDDGVNPLTLIFDDQGYWTLPDPGGFSIGFPDSVLKIIDAASKAAYVGAATGYREGFFSGSRSTILQFDFTEEIIAGTLRLPLRAYIPSPHRARRR